MAKVRAGSGMDFRASVERDLLTGTSAVRLGGSYPDGTFFVATSVAEDGDVIFEEAERGVYTDPFLRFSDEALIALRDALNGHAPPTSDADLRDALKVERSRVDRIIDNALEGGL